MMNMKLILSTLLLSSVAMMAHADEGKKHRHNPDLNGDGVVTVSELLEQRQAKFKKMDLNGDGYVTEAETAELKAKMDAKREKMRNEKAKAHFAKADSNGDGMISAAEFTSKSEERIKLMDADGNGEISRQEMRAAKHGMRKG
jgi:Ca2+-binding EF-hand superfamily protein